MQTFLKIHERKRLLKTSWIDFRFVLYFFLFILETTEKVDLINIEFVAIHYYYFYFSFSNKKKKLS